MTPRERKQPGTRPCGGRGCKTCPMLQTMDSITSHSTGNTHKIKTSDSCKSTNVVYVIRCQRCGLQYVGETEQALHERINSHRSDVKLSKTDRPVAAHFNSPNHTTQDMKVMIVEQVRKKVSWMRKTRESHWIAILDTIHPSGMNLDP